MPMFRTQKEKVQHYYKELVRCVIGQNIHLVFSLRNDNKISIVQMLNTQTDEERVDSPVRNAISLFRYNIINMLNALVYIAIRLPQEEIPVEYRQFITDLRKISVSSQETFVQGVGELGYAPKKFQGEQYQNFFQEITGNDKKWNEFQRNA